MYYFQIIHYYRHHQVKIFSQRRRKMDYYSDIHRQQKNLPWEYKITGGGIPFFMGNCQFVDSL